MPDRNYSCSINGSKIVSDDKRQRWIPICWWTTAGMIQLEVAISFQFVHGPLRFCRLAKSRKACSRKKLSRWNRHALVCTITRLIPLNFWNPNCWLNKLFVETNCLYSLWLISFSAIALLPGLSEFGPPFVGIRGISNWRPERPPPSPWKHCWGDMCCCCWFWVEAWRVLTPKRRQRVPKGYNLGSFRLATADGSRPWSASPRNGGALLWLFWNAGFPAVKYRARDLLLWSGCSERKQADIECPTQWQLCQ